MVSHDARMMQRLVMGRVEVVFLENPYGYAYSLSE